MNLCRQIFLRMDKKEQNKIKNWHIEIHQNKNALFFVSFWYMKYINLPIQEAKQLPSKINPKKSTPTVTHQSKTWKNKDKEKIFLNIQREMAHHLQKKAPIEVTADSSSETMACRRK